MTSVDSGSSATPQGVVSGRVSCSTTATRASRSDRACSQFLCERCGRGWAAERSGRLAAPPEARTAELGPLPALCWLDPSLCGPSGRRYATYLGGNVGQDVVFALATESSGIVTVAGITAGGTFPVTPRCMQPILAPGQFGGQVARIAMDGN